MYLVSIRKIRQVGQVSDLFAQIADLRHVWLHILPIKACARNCNYRYIYFH